MAPLTASLVTSEAAAQPAWQPVQGPLLTRWTKAVSPQDVRPEYPRPQMKREECGTMWTSVSTAIGAAMLITPLIRFPTALQAAVATLARHSRPTLEIHHCRTCKPVAGERL